MNDKMDELLKEALTPMDDPSELLNHRVLQKGKESMNMKKKTKRKISAAAVVAACFLALGGGSAVGAYRYLSPSNVAQALKYEELQEAFQGKDAQLMNETQEMAGFKITLLGILSGKDITNGKIDFTQEDGTIQDDLSYMVVAMERADGTPLKDVDLHSTSGGGMPEFEFGFCVQGIEPEDFGSLETKGYARTVKDGVAYWLLTTSNIEMFADRDVYLRMNSMTFGSDEAYAYDMDEKTGEITQNKNYCGINALFKLPLDESKADPKSAEKYLEETSDWKWDDEEKQAKNTVKKYMEEITPDNLTDYAEPIESSEKMLKINRYDQIYFKAGSESGMVNERIQVPVEALFPEHKTGMCQKFIFGYPDGYDTEQLEEELRIQVFTLNKDDTVTHVTYRLKK